MIFFRKMEKEMWDKLGKNISKLKEVGKNGI